MTLVSAIVVTQRGGPLLDACLGALRVALDRVPVDGAGRRASEIVVVDNSAEGIVVEGARVLTMGRNSGFAGGVAAGLDAAGGEWALLVNDDAEVEPDAVALLLAAGRAEPRAGSVTGQVRFHGRRDLVNTAGLVIDRLGIAYDRLAGAPAREGGPVEDVFGASACVALYRRAMLDAIGGFDASFFAFGEDADVAWRARMAGWTCLYVPGAVAYHHGSATAGEASPAKYFLVGRNRARLLAKNATTGQLLRWGWAMALYDLAYVAFAGAADRSAAPLRGRVAGLREWRHYRRAGEPGRRPIPLAPPTGPLGTWRQRAAYRKGGRP